MDDKKLLLNVKESILLNAISFITIIDVEEKENFDGSINLYIKTNDLSTVNFEKLSNVALELSNQIVDVQLVMAESNMVGEDILKNKDTISVYIELKNP